MTEPIRHFLLVYDHDQAKLIETRDFGEDADAALSAYAATEAIYEGQQRIEVVLIGSDSLETIKVTHANYFGGLPTTSKYLAGI